MSHGIEIFDDHSKFPKGNYETAAIKKRQIIDIEINEVVTKYQAEALRCWAIRRQVKNTAMISITS
ncbi:MAG: hypothetical protein KAH18_09815 [Psychromonas sp.]|nr:hypothetical protein [Psychromonas sp.]